MREGERGVHSLRDMPSWFCSLPDQSPGQGLGVEPMMGELGMVRGWEGHTLERIW